MEKLKKMARMLDGFAKIGLLLCAIAAVLTAAVAGTLVIVPANIPKFKSMLNTFAISLGPVSVDLAEGHALGDRALLWYLLSTVLASLAADAFLCFGILVFRRILRPMKEGRPFDTAVSGSLRTMGVLILVGSTVSYALKTGFTALFYRAFDVGALFDPGAVTGYKLNYSFDGAPLLAGLLLFLLSYIFKYGEELQSQSDETL